MDSRISMDIFISLSIGKGSIKGSKPVQGVSLTYSYNNKNTEQNTVANRYSDTLLHRLTTVATSTKFNIHKTNNN